MIIDFATVIFCQEQKLLFGKIRMIPQKHSDHVYPVLYACFRNAVVTNFNVITCE